MFQIFNRLLRFLGAPARYRTALVIFAGIGITTVFLPQSVCGQTVCGQNQAVIGDSSDELSRDDNASGKDAYGDTLDLVTSQIGDLPIVISAPHGGQLAIPGVPARQGEGMKTGAAGFTVVRDGGTEELAFEVARRLAKRMEGQPSFVISRVRRRYVDFNRPPEIGVEHPGARVIYDQYHNALADAVREIRSRHRVGMLIDLHGQGTSASTVYRGTSNGLTVTALRKLSDGELHHGATSLMAILKGKGWRVHPDPLDGREQSGFTGGHIVRTYGSHRSNGIDAVQLELGADYRRSDVREKIATELADAIALHLQHLRSEFDRKTSAD